MTAVPGVGRLRVRPLVRNAVLLPLLLSARSCNTAGNGTVPEKVRQSVKHTKKKKHNTRITVGSMMPPPPPTSNPPFFVLPGVSVA